MQKRLELARWLRTARSALRVATYCYACCLMRTMQQQHSMKENNQRKRGKGKNMVCGCAEHENTTARNTVVFIKVRQYGMRE